MRLALHWLKTGLMCDLRALHIQKHDYWVVFVQSLRNVHPFKTLLMLAGKTADIDQDSRKCPSPRTGRYFFGLEYGLSNLQGCSVVMVPYQVERRKGVMSVIGLLHIDYRRVILIISGMAKIVERAFK